MNKNIATFPLTEAFRSGDECPFCNLERSAEQHAISFILGSAYMEDDIRAATDATGFCRHHYKMMYDYGNRLGSAWILSTHMKKLNEELATELGVTKPYVSMILNGARKPAGIRKRMEDAFKEVVRKKNGTTVDELLSESGKENETSETA